MRIVKYISFLSLLLLTASCSDYLFEDLIITNEEDSDGMSFTVSTVEMADQIVNMGGTRANRSENSEGTVCSDAFVSHPLTGDASYGLQVHRMPLPYVGIHRKAVNVPCVEPSESADHSTRAPVAAIVDASATNFHDSLSIWGYTNAVYKDTGEGVDANKTIFKQTLLKKVNNWRSSVHWPYGTDSDKPTKMRFYAIAPAVENIDVQLTGSAPNFTTSPTFTYTLPETAGEMRDLLYGESEEIAVQPGPTGSTNGDPKAENLGKDNKFVGLTFQHILTCIRFAMGTIPNGITIQQIAIEGVGTSAIFTPSATDAATTTSGAWSASSGSATYTLWPQGVTSTSGSNVYIDGDSCFFMIPQTLSSSAKLTVTLSAPQHYEVDDNGVYTPYDGERTSASSGSSRTHTLSCSLSGDIWKKGYTVTYKLTVGEVEDGYYLIAENPEAHEHSNASINGAFPVHSYRSYFDYSDGKEVTTHAVNWKVVGYSTISGVESETNKFKEDKPEWLHGTTPNTAGIYEGGYGAIASYSIDAQSYTKSGNHATILGVNSQEEAADNLDLSRNTPNMEVKESQETANCYIVNRHGSYSFPLIYGNGNENTFSPNLFFKDHVGATITSPFIKTQIEAKNTGEITADPSAPTNGTCREYDWSTSNLRAIVLWQDTPELISSLSVTPSSGDNGTISFTVSKSTPANAVIALQGRKVIVPYTRIDNGGGEYTEWTRKQPDTPELIDEGNNWETFWTWHIWMTDEVYKNEGSENGVNFDKMYLNWDETNHLVSLQNKANNQNTILPVNLGWVPDDNDFGFYDHREVWVKLEQEEPAIVGASKQSTIVKIEQHARQPLVTGTSTIYQWGRPTALPMLKKVDGTLRPIYGASGNTDISANFTGKKVTNYWEFIESPYNLLKDNSNSKGWWPNGTEYAFWSAASGEKTIYDPCPPGFQMPSYGVFTGTSRHPSADVATKGLYLNIWPDATNDEGQTVKSGEQRKGAYLYTKYHEATTETTTIPTDHRYDQLFYLPTTGRWSGDATEGESYANKQSDTSTGIYWCAEHDGTTGGKALWLKPEWSEEYTYSGTGEDKSPVQRQKTLNYNIALPIRPVVKP
ncbi:MAG: hypothetical protein IJR02_10315 [Bacteroidaceae bacterium]|nr:hypothetical protein [Bacteroidaceae bacterium]